MTKQDLIDAGLTLDDLKTTRMTLLALSKCFVSQDNRDVPWHAFLLVKKLILELEKEL